VAEEAIDYEFNGNSSLSIDLKGKDVVFEAIATLVVVVLGYSNQESSPTYSTSTSSSSITTSTGLLESLMIAVAVV
jgi:hypothetical protein